MFCEIVLMQFNMLLPRAAYLASAAAYHPCSKGQQNATCACVLADPTYHPLQLSQVSSEQYISLILLLLEMGHNGIHCYFPVTGFETEFS